MKPLQTRGLEPAARRTFRHNTNGSITAVKIHHTGAMGFTNPAKSSSGLSGKYIFQPAVAITANGKTETYERGAKKHTGLSGIAAISRLQACTKKAFLCTLKHAAQLP